MSRTFFEARYLNRCTRELIGDWRTEPVAFFCECSDETCYLSVWLTARGYDQVLARGEAVLAVGHEAPPLDATLLEEVRGTRAVKSADAVGQERGEAARA